MFPLHGAFENRYLEENGISNDRKGCPRDPITLSEDDWGVQSHAKRKVFRFQYHSQKVSQHP